MTAGLIIAIDQGTTNTKALAVDEDGRVRATAAVPMQVHYPQPGWAEQSADGIWQSVRQALVELVGKVGPGIDALAISNQRETIVAWDAKTGEPLAPAILWQCRRSAGRCAALRQSGAGTYIEETTGLGIDPLFPAAKLGWLIDNVEGVRAAAASGQLRVGTVDTWLLWKLTAGRSYATDQSNASRTQLFNTHALRWDGELCRLFGVPAGALGEVRPSDSLFGTVEAGVTALPGGVPIHAMLGDSHAALFGHRVRQPGAVKATYGTGSSLMTLTRSRIASRHGLSSTIAWGTRDGPAYAIEGNISVSGQAAAFMSELLGCRDIADLAERAQSVPDSNGVSFVPALVGLGAPHWNPEARGLIAGLTLGVKPAHLARAAIEAIAHQIADVFEAMEQDVGAPLDRLSVDGGASRNDQLMQLQADLLDRKVQRGSIAEVSAVGAAMMAASGLGRPFAEQTEDLETFEPRMSAGARESLRAAWLDAVRRATLAHDATFTSNKAPGQASRNQGGHP